MIITREWIDVVAPEHGRTSCSDELQNNGDGGWTGKFDENTGQKVINTPRCNRCYLLDHEGEETSELEFKPVVSVTLVWQSPEPKFKVGDRGLINGMAVVFTTDGWRRA